jgi:hypothetical protein
MRWPCSRARVSAMGAKWSVMGWEVWAARAVCLVFQVLVMSMMVGRVRGWLVRSRLL